MKCKSVCNLPETAQVNDADGILVTQGGKTVRMLMSALRAYIGFATGADVLGVPVPTASDSGKVPTVKSSGDGYELTSLAAVAKSGKYSDLQGTPEIPIIPTSLPANGGNADTLDGYHATAFAPASRGVSFESWTFSAEGMSMHAMRIYGVKAILLQAKDDYTGIICTGIWTPETSGLLNRLHFHKDGIVGEIPTTVTIKNSAVEVSAECYNPATFYITAILN